MTTPFLMSFGDAIDGRSVRESRFFVNPALVYTMAMRERLPKSESKHERASELPKEESGVRKIDVEDTAERDDLRKNRLIIGTTKHIIKLMREEADLLRRVIHADALLQDARIALEYQQPEDFIERIFMSKEKRQKLATLKERIQTQENALEALKEQYENEFAQEDIHGMKMDLLGGLDGRLRKVVHNIEKQEDILKREQENFLRLKHLKISSVSENGRSSPSER